MKNGPKFIRDARAKLDYTQEEMARAMGYKSALAINRLEMGKRKVSGMARKIVLYLLEYGPIEGDK